MAILAILLFLALYLYWPLVVAAILLTPIYVWFIKPYREKKREERMRQWAKEHTSLEILLMCYGEMPDDDK